jgi:phosphopantothenate-cysteine ligase/phosphopantothenoylcysteine decarboxylase/phosphopantothenate--cysteine ligase
MNILVTAGNTQTPIDKVRCITNVFSGRTGTQIALEARRRGHRVCLLTSHPEVVTELSAPGPRSDDSWRVRTYRTFDDLHRLMAEEIPGSRFDAVVHCAAVSDYATAGVYGVATDTCFDPTDQQWHATNGFPQLADATAGKVKSHYDELWVRLTRTPKLVDLIRSVWGFRGIVVKFKLEVGLDRSQLLAVASHSRRHSDADLVVANTLEEMHDVAHIGSRNESWQTTNRSDLPNALIRHVEGLFC